MLVILQGMALTGRGTNIQCLRDTIPYLLPIIKPTAGTTRTILSGSLIIRPKNGILRIQQMTRC